MARNPHVPCVWGRLCCVVWVSKLGKALPHLSSR